MKIIISVIIPVYNGVSVIDDIHHDLEMQEFRDLAPCYNFGQ